MTTRECKSRPRLHILKIDPQELWTQFNSLVLKNKCWRRSFDSEVSNEQEGQGNSLITIRILSYHVSSGVLRGFDPNAQRNKHEKVHLIFQMNEKDHDNAMMEIKAHFTYYLSDSQSSII